MNKMDPERWRQIEQLYNSALELEPNQREAFLKSACPEDESIRKEVRRLLKHQDEAEDFIESPAMGTLKEVGQREPPSLLGQQFGSYRITAELGRGGMGEVYQAKDERLGRNVAIKVLPEEFAKDVVRIARFNREAKLLASLNHPNIATIHGLEETDDIRFLVLELVEGDTLKERIMQGPIPVEEALQRALQIAEALEAAHEKGVVHRDLKPANIKVTPDGKVKVLDFGLAKAYAVDAGNMNLSVTPKLNEADTIPGVILGTAAYMSPEQAKGRATDKRTDIWAFGCVLYEMITGRQSFGAPDVSETLAAVMRADPDWSSLPQNLKPRIREVLERCLEKDLNRRFKDIGDVKEDIERILGNPEGLHVSQALSGTQRRTTKLYWAAGLLAAVAVGTGIWIVTSLQTRESGAVTRFILAAEGVGNNNGMAWSPDGSVLIYGATVDGINRLFMRRRDQFEAVPIQGTEGAVYPFVSPDGESVGFFADNELRRASLIGGTAMKIGDVGRRLGASWGPDETIVYASASYPGLMRIAAAGGKAVPLTTPSEDDRHIWPRFLPDGSGVLFTVYHGQTDWDLAVLSLETNEYTILTEGTDGTYVPSGHVVFAREASLWGVGFDLRRQELVGSPVQILQDVQVNTGGWALYSLAADGSLAYLPGGTEVQEILTWVDRSGNEDVIEGLTGIFYEPRISPDGSRVSVSQSGATPGSKDVYVLDLMRRNQRVRLTFDGAENRHALWLGRDQILFSSQREGFGIYSRRADGTGSEEVVISGQPGLRGLHPTWVAPDGSTLLVTQSTGSIDVGQVEATRDSAPEVLLGEDYGESGAVLSPQRRWMAYQSNETGRIEVWAIRYPEMDLKRPISTDGGANPVWSADGRELFFSNKIGMQVVQVIQADEESFEATLPVTLFSDEALIYAPPRQWDVTSDGQRFLMVRRTAGGFGRIVRQSKLYIVENWFEELKERVPVD